MRSGAATFFLPPQSASQWWILTRLRAAGVAPHSFHWSDLAAPDALSEETPIHQRIPILRALIAELSGRLEARRRFRESLAAIASHPWDELAAAQSAFFRSLGSDGAEAIASGLFEDAKAEPARDMIR